MWTWSSFEQLWRDTRLAARGLQRAPLFTVTAVLSLGLGIGANIASFSFADAALFRPLAIDRPSELVAIRSATTQKPLDGISYRNYVDIRDRAKSFSGVVAHTLARLAFTPAREAVPQMKFGMQVSRQFFPIIGVQPVIGRTFTDAESTTPKRDPVLVLSYDFWRQQFGLDPKAIGRTVYVNGAAFTIIGALPESFTGMDPFMRPSFYVPLDGSAMEDRAFHSLSLEGRMRPGVTLQQARAELTAIASSLAAEYPSANRDRGLTAHTQFMLRVQDSPPMAAMVAMLLTLALLVLSISCANVASLLLARTRARSREIAIRLAIGAGRAKLVQQFLVESLMLAALGGLAGMGFAHSVVEFLAAFRLPTDTPMGISAQLDGRLLLFSAAISVISAVLFGVIPALASLRPQVIPSLKAVTADGQSRNRGRSVLVAAQVALSLVLLVVSSSMFDAFRKMVMLDPGIRTTRLMMFEFDPTMVGYSRDRTASFYRQLIDRTRALPGVKNATLSRAFPFRPNFNDESIVPEGFQMPAGQTAISIPTNVVDEQYFDTVGTPLLQGRAFTTADSADSRAVAVVNAEFAKRYWPGQEPIGKRLRLGANGRYVEVVGVARTAKYLSLAETPQPYLYLPLSQNPRARRMLLVQTEGASGPIMDPVLKTIHEIEPDQPVFNVRTIENYYEQGVLGPALVLIQMVGATGLIGLTLTVVGLYGLIAYSVSRRTREIGVRMALGADRLHVLRLVLRQGITLAAIGVAVGMAISVPVFRLLSSRLSGLGELSLWTLVMVPAGLILVAVCACLMPARHASGIDPTQALRSD